MVSKREDEELLVILQSSSSFFSCPFLYNLFTKAFLSFNCFESELEQTSYNPFGQDRTKGTQYLDESLLELEGLLTSFFSLSLSPRPPRAMLPLPFVGDKTLGWGTRTIHLLH